MFSLKQRLKFNHGSVLVFSLIVLFIGISAAIGIASSTLISQRSSMTTASSVQSFQVADSGAEIFLNKFKSADSDATLGSLGIGSCNSGNGLISGNIGTGRDYEIIAYDINNSPLACSASLSSVDRIKSVGKYKNTSRAVEMAVAAEKGLECKIFSNPTKNGEAIGDVEAALWGSTSPPVYAISAQKWCEEKGYTIGLDRQQSGWDGTTPCWVYRNSWVRAPHHCLRIESLLCCN